MKTCLKNICLILSLILVTMCQGFLRRGPQHPKTNAFLAELGKKPYDEKVLQTYLEEGVSVNSVGSGNFSALMLAIRDGNDNAAKFLVKNGANVNAFNMGGQGALGIASLNKNSDMFIYLIENKAKIEKVDLTGNSALHLAASEQMMPAIKYLIEKKKVDVNAQGFAKKTPLHMASDKLIKALKNNWGKEITESHEIVNYLLANGADCTIKDNSEKTPIDYANAALKSIKDEKNRAKLEALIGTCKKNHSSHN